MRQIIDSDWSAGTLVLTLHGGPSPYPHPYPVPMYGGRGCSICQNVEVITLKRAA